MEMFHFCIVYMWHMAVIWDSAGLDFGVKTTPHFTGCYLLTDFRLFLWAGTLHTRHTAGQEVQRLLDSSPVSPSNQVSFCMSTWHRQQGPSPWVPLRQCTSAVETEKPFPAPQRSLPSQSGAHSFPCYKSILRNLASDKEILCVRILPVPRSFKTELLFSLIQGASGLFIVLTDLWKKLLCTELLKVMGRRQNSRALSGRFRKQSCTVQGCSLMLWLVPTLYCGK